MPDPYRSADRLEHLARQLDLIPATPVARVSREMMIARGCVIDVPPRRARPSAKTAKK